MKLYDSVNLSRRHCGCQACRQSFSQWQGTVVRTGRPTIVEWAHSRDGIADHYSWHWRPYRELAPISHSQYIANLWSQCMERHGAAQLAKALGIERYVWLSKVYLAVSNFRLAFEEDAPAL